MEHGPLDEVARFLAGAGRRPAARTHPKTTRRARSTDAVALEEVEAELHDEFTDDRKPATHRPVTIVNASEKKQLQLRIEVPVEDMARLPAEAAGAAAQEVVRPSIWSSIHPRLLDLIRGFDEARDLRELFEW